MMPGFDGHHSTRLKQGKQAIARFPHELGPFEDSGQEPLHTLNVMGG